MSPHDEEIAVNNINDSGRIRADLGDLNGLANSIRQYGIIQPIVLQRNGDENNYILVAGGRRLAALRLNGVQVLRHGKEYIWRDEDLSTPAGHLRLQAVELEENIKRKSLSWPEEIEGKRRLLEIMQSIEGYGGSGRSAGFTQKQLASMLGESESVTSRDLELAGFVKQFPALAQLPTRNDASRRLTVAMTVAAMKNAVKPKVAPITTFMTVDVTTAASPIIAPEPEPRWRLYEGRFQDNIHEVADSSVDLICTDLPYNIGLGDSTASHGAGLSQFSDSNLDIAQLCADVAVESYRVLRDCRFGVFFYGFNYHEVFRAALESAGFTVDTYPFIWIRDRTAPPDGTARYAKSYDPALIASKGSPRFIRPNQANSMAIPSVRGPERLHASQKPTLVMEKFILDMTIEDAIVLDMFAGAGTTGEAALRNKRKAILFELEKSSCEIIKARLGVIK